MAKHIHSEQGVEVKAAVKAEAHRRFEYKWEGVGVLLGSGMEGNAKEKSFSLRFALR